MKYKITLIIESDDELFKNDLDKGHIQNGIQNDVLESEQLIGFEYEEVKE